MIRFPNQIICLTEEPVEILYAIGAQDVIAGVSVYVKRPVQAQKLPKIGHFSHVNIEKICNMNADLIIGHSDVQKDIARELIGKGQSVYISNHRSIEEILNYTLWLSALVGRKEEGISYIKILEKKIETVQKRNFKKRPRVYFEEWNDPMISGIQWVFELIELCGGKNVVGTSSLAKDRIHSAGEIIKLNPEIILACWCGKKVQKKEIKERLSGTLAVNDERIYELDPSIFLQPGPAPIVEGIDVLLEIFHDE